MQHLKRTTIVSLAAATTAVFGLGMFSGAFAAALFRDVPPTHWAYNSVNWANANGIMMGPSHMPGYFLPGNPANRAELATVLMRYDQMVRANLDALDRRLDRVENGSSSSSARSSSSSRMSSSSWSSSRSSSSSVMSSSSANSSNSSASSMSSTSSNSSASSFSS